MATQVDRPHPPAAVALPLELGFRALAAVRRARVFHPTGRNYEGELKFWPERAPEGVDLFERPGPHPVIARLSRGIGLPEPVPDVLGLAIKIRDAYGPGHDQDFTFASCFPGPLGHLTLFPATGWLGTPFSSILPYKVGERTLVLGALPDTRVEVEGTGTDELRDAVGEGVLRFRFVISPLIGRWKEIGVLYLEERTPGQGVSFDPWNAGADLQPTGVLNMLRVPAYQGSRTGRNATAT